MAITIKKNSAADSILRTVEERSGIDLGACLQCRKCTSGCPVSGSIQSPPSEVVRRLLMCAGNELLKTDLVWMCLTCGTCYARCPMKIDIASVMDALRAMALEKGAAKPQGDMPLFNREFLRTVESSGRSYDLSTIIGYKIGTKDFMKDADKFPAMLKKGKMSLLPPSGADKQTVKKIFSKARKDKGTGK